MLEWIWTQLLMLFAHAEIRAGVAGLALGIALTDFVARMLPRTVDSDFATRVVRLTVFGAATCAGFGLNPTPLGFVLALIVGSSAPAIQVLMMRAIYMRWPAMKPPALVPGPNDREPPPSLLRPAEPISCSKDS